jgi:hypothetical protein
LKILLGIIISCVAYTFLNHQLLGVSYSDLNLVQTMFRSLAIYSSMFLIYSALPIAISLLVAKAPKQNRLKPYFPYFKVALAITWAFALIGLYFGWYAVQATNS